MCKLQRLVVKRELYKHAMVLHPSIVKHNDQKGAESRASCRNWYLIEGFTTNKIHDTDVPKSLEIIDFRWEIVTFPWSKAGNKLFKIVDFRQGNLLHLVKTGTKPVKIGNKARN